MLSADLLELTLQFGMIMMFACAFPLAFSFAALVYIFLTFHEASISRYKKEACMIYVKVKLQ